MAKGKGKEAGWPFLQPPADGEGTQPFQHDVSCDPLEERRYQRLPDKVKDEIIRLSKQVESHPRRAIPDLVSLIEKYPRIPVLYNYLSVAYDASGQREKADAVARENYRQNPDCLFARLDYAELYLAEGDYNRVAEILEHEFDLTDLYPDREEFHVMEVVRFLGLVGLYFLKTDRREAAEARYEILKEVAPEHHQTQRLGRELYPGCLARIVQRLMG